jgi:uncharacterized DUF497 family protein
MKTISFEWDRHKAASNLAKHKIPFEEAKSVFFDANARMIYDPDHSEKEERFIILGLSSLLRLLIVCHCYKNTSGKIIRIISARKANKIEKKQYAGFLS